jgi:hypothetical protein
MRATTIRVATVAALALAGVLVGTGAQFGANRARSYAQYLDGSWVLTANVQGEPLIHALITFSKEGSFIETSAAPGVSTGHGVWTRTGDGKFSLTNVYLRLSKSGTFIGTTKVRAVFTVNQSGNSGGGSFQTSVFDAGGKQISTFGGSANATRIKP